MYKVSIDEEFETLYRKNATKSCVLGECLLLKKNLDGRYAGEII